MRVRKLILFTVMLACLIQTAKCIAQDSPGQLSQDTVRFPKPDFNREIYYKNRIDFSFESGWLPINIPLPFDFVSGDAYNTYPLKYTLAPVIASLRWHMNGIGGPWVLRGNWDFQFSGSVTAIPRGPETRGASNGFQAAIADAGWPTKSSAHPVHQRASAACLSRGRAAN